VGRVTGCRDQPNRQFRFCPSNRNTRQGVLGLDHWCRPRRCEPDR